MFNGESDFHQDHPDSFMTPWWHGKNAQHAPRAKIQRQQRPNTTGTGHSPSFKHTSQNLGSCVMPANAFTHILHSCVCVVFQYSCKCVCVSSFLEYVYLVCPYPSSTLQHPSNWHYHVILTVFEELSWGPMHILYLSTYLTKNYILYLHVCIHVSVNNCK